MRSVAFACLLVAACQPVLLFGDDVPGSSTALPREQVDPSAAGSGGAGMLTSVEPPARTAAPNAFVAVKVVDCGRCFELLASGAGGVPPYRFEWEDGSNSAQRRVCAQRSGLEVSVVVQDAASARSSAYVVRLETEADASCPPASQPIRKLCVMNPSFEGVAAMNSGLPEMFDAAPWSTCTNPSATNTPDIGNDSIAQTVPPPKPTDGKTFLALGEGEQVSQKLCASVPADTELNLQLDLSLVDLSGGVAPSGEAVFLEIWGGMASDCSQRQLLWTSLPLSAGWKRYCGKLKVGAFMDQITLRANTDNATLAPSFLLVDNLVPVDACP